jgi:hypothetical protein
MEIIEYEDVWDDDGTPVNGGAQAPAPQQWAATPQYTTTPWAAPASQYTTPQWGASTPR